MKPKIINLAIIIPTLNEENYIGKLLDSIYSQTIHPREIVVVDAFSQDRTIKEIKKRQKKLTNLKYYQIPQYSISRQRNYGAKKSRAENILFIDADNQFVKKDTLEKYLLEINEKRPDLGTALDVPMSDFWKDKVFFFLINLTVILLRPYWPIIPPNMNLYIKRNVFNKLKGFDEEVKIGEDMELLQRFIKNDCKFVLFSKPKNYVSVRRFEKEGRRSFSFKMLQAFYYVNTRGFRNNPIEYEFGHHNQALPKS